MSNLPISALNTQNVYVHVNNTQQHTLTDLIRHVTSLKPSVKAPEVFSWGGYTMRVEYIPNRVRMSRASHRLIFDPPHPDPRLGRAQSNSRSEGIPVFM